MNDTLPPVTKPMQRWLPDADPRQARRVGKTLEELSELAAVLARISIQGLDSVDPSSGKTNRVRLQEELADVQAQIACTVLTLDLDQRLIARRTMVKMHQMAEWEAHFA
jgi:NTP pyrophosphatase (non-canonical NTP hydrolase)